MIAIETCPGGCEHPIHAEDQTCPLQGITGADIAQWRFDDVTS